VLALADPVDSDDVPEVARPARLDTRERVFEDGGVGSSHLQLLRRRQERIGRRLAAQVPVGRDDSVDANLEEVLDSRGLQHFACIGARRHHRPVEARVAHRADVTDRAFVDLDAVTPQQREHELVLAVAEPADRLGRGRVARLAFGKLDPARGEEGAHAVITGLAVDVGAVVGHRVEGDERLAPPLRPLAQERVEQLLPRLRVHARSLSENAVEVEQAAPNPARQPESLGGVRHRQNLQKQSAPKTKKPPGGSFFVRRADFAFVHRSR